MDIHREIILCRDNADKLNSLIEKYQPFIFETTYKIEREFNYNKGELSTIGMMAFKEAIEKYDSNRGNFFSYAKLVIKSRAIDYLRKNKKVITNEKLIIYDSEQNENIMVLEKNTIEQYNEISINESRKLEIEEIKKYLKDFEIKFEELILISPKKKKLRNLYIEIAKYISENEYIINKIFGNKRLPIKELCFEFKNQRKKIERGRKYIIFLTIVLTGDFPLMRSYIGMEVLR